MKVLFICTANVCRSPLAEGYLKHLLRAHPIKKLEVASAGVLAVNGYPVFECAVEVARQTGFDLSSHKARLLTSEMAQEADSILCMETLHVSKVLDLDNKLISKTSLLGNYHPSKKHLFQISDPRNFDVECTRETFQLIQDSVEGLHKKLLAAT
jgi:low molecular weight protein-tyrosine phosphatase